MTNELSAKLDEIAMHYHDMTGDNDTVPWEKCSSRYRTQVRKMVRNVINCQALAQQALRTTEAGEYTTEDGLRRARQIAIQSEAAPLCMGEIIKVADMALGEITPTPEWMASDIAPQEAGDVKALMDLIENEGSAAMIRRARTLTEGSSR